jgi:hypothetical protein
MPTYQLLTDRTLAQASAITPTTLIHIVTTGDTSQNAAGSSYKAELGQLVGLFSGASDTLVTGGTYSDGTITFTNNSGGTFNVSGLTEPFTGGTVSGATIFTGGLSANTFSASSIFVNGVQITGDTFVTGATYSAGTAIFTNNQGNQFNLTGLTEPFSGGSGNCITDLYTTNIHSCSPLNINPLDEGNVYFGSTSGVTIDLTNTRLGIGTSTPQFPFQIVGANNTFFYDPTSVGGRFNVSGNTNLPRYDVSIGAYLTRPATGGSVGMRAWNDATFPGYGKVGDMYMYVGSETYGLNIINGTGTNTEDYIRFYAGTDATSTSDIHIQGTGTTRGFVGLGIENPTAKLHVFGSTIVTGTLTATTISATTYENLPVSGLTAGTNIGLVNNNGNYTISVTGITGGSSIDPYYNSGSGSTITWDVSGQSTNYEATLTATTTLNLTGVTNGDYGTIILTQDSVGSRTITLGTVNGLSTTHRVVNGGGGVVILTSNASATDILTFTYNGTVMYWTVGNDYT